MGFREFVFQECSKNSLTYEDIANFNGEEWIALAEKWHNEEIHIKPTTYDCKVCGMPFGDKLSLYEHYNFRHNKQ